MDEQVASIVKFVTGLRAENLPAEVRHQATRAILDSLGCIFGGYGEPPAVIARNLAAGIAPRDPAAVARLLIDGTATTTDLAAFANGIMLRVLDYNDTYHAPYVGGHPSDLIAAALAVGEPAHCDGRTFLGAVVAGYEVFCRLLQSADPAAVRWDHATFHAAAACATACSVLRLSPEVTANAVGLALVPNIALNATRLGEVSMWKGCAGPNGLRNGLFAANLARAGMTGPQRPFDGPGGLFAAAIDPFPPLPLGRDQEYLISRVQFKRYPVGSLAQSAATAAEDLHSLGLRSEDIAEIKVLTCKRAIYVMANDPDKWRPVTRESADHSIPFVVSQTLLHGGLTTSDLEDAAYRDPEVVSLMSRLSVEQDAECEAAHPETTMARIRIRLAGSGEWREAAARFHRGHFNNPMSDAELEAKFRSQASGVIGDQQTDELTQSLWALESVEDISSLVSLAIRR